jgi:transcription elongation factor GreA
MRETLVTPDGLVRMQQELERLVAVRPTIVERIATARELGDLKENAEYHAAREEQGFLETKIQQLEERIRTAKVVDKVDTAAAGLGCVVSTVDEETGEEVDYTIVGSTEADPLSYRVSNESPIGQALMEQGVGAVVEVPLPRGSMRLRIAAIRAE